MEQTVTTVPDDQSVSPEGHDEIMAARGEEQERLNQGEEPKADITPSESPKILDKFNSQDDLIKGYTDSQAELTRAKMELAELKKGSKSEETSPSPETDQNAQEFLQEKGLDYSIYEEEVLTNGQLSLESLAELNKAGISPEVAQKYVETQNQYVETMRETAFSLAGSEESYNAMTQWAKGSLSEGEQTVFNEAVTSGDQDKARQAIESLAFRYQSHFGKTPTGQLSGQRNAPSTGFQSEAQIVEAMSDSRYQSDPAYRAAVQRKMQASPVFG